MKRPRIKKPKPIKYCGGKKGKGCGSDWAGSTKGLTDIRIAA